MAGEDTETIVPLSPPYRAVSENSGSARTPGCAPSWIRASDAAAATETSENPVSGDVTPRVTPGVIARSPPSVTATSTTRPTVARPTATLTTYGGPPATAVAPVRSASSAIHACMAAGVVASVCSHCRRAGSPPAMMSATGSGGIIPEAPEDPAAGSSPSRPSRSRAAPVADAASACSTAVSRWASSGPMALAESSVTSIGWLAPGSCRPCTTTPTEGVPEEVVSGTDAVSPTLLSVLSATVTVADSVAVASATSPGSAESRPGRNTTPGPAFTRSSGTRISASTEAGAVAAIRAPADTTVPRPFGSSTANRLTASVSPNSGTQVRPGSSVTGAVWSPSASWTNCTSASRWPASRSIAPRYGPGFSNQPATMSPDPSSSPSAVASAATSPRLDPSMLIGP